MNILNTKNRGTARAIIFKSGKNYKAVCLDFDLIEEAGSREKAEKMIRESIIGYIKNVCKNKLDDKLLNRHADKKYWNIYNKLLKVADARTNTRPKNNIDRTSSMFTLPINLKEFCFA